MRDEGKRKDSVIKRRLKYEFPHAIRGEIIRERKLDTPIIIGVDASYDEE
jgi:hypothetical protein